MRTSTTQTSLCKHTVSPRHSLLAHTSDLLLCPSSQKERQVHVDGDSDKNKSKQGRIQDFWKIDLSRGDPGFLEGGSAL